MVIPRNFLRINWNLRSNFLPMFFPSRPWKHGNNGRKNTPPSTKATRFKGVTASSTAASNGTRTKSFLFRGVKKVPSLKETAKAPENRPFQKETIVFQPSIFGCYVSFREGICLFFFWGVLNTSVSLKLFWTEVFSGIFWKEIWSGLQTVEY